MLSDQRTRELAIDPAHSFVVQAPAGSGKTELLTQRFLKLLAHVDHPEQIIALTFTKKAANEMKHRVLATLERAQDPILSKSLRPETYNLALATLKQDQLKSWNLKFQPHKLNIMTLDALCQVILKSSPLNKEEYGELEIDPYPERMYTSAASQCFQYALEDKTLRPLLISLLRHLDNQQDKLIYLWVDLLKIRDQWISLLWHGQSRHCMESTLNLLRHEALLRLKNSIPKCLHLDFIELVKLFSMIPTAPSWSNALQELSDFDYLSMEQAQALSKLCLTSQKTVRKKVDHHVGIRKDDVSAEVFNKLKSISEEIFEKLAMEDSFVDALIDVQRCPDSSYDEQQWQILQNLFQLLLNLVAHLKWVFKETGKVDFIEISMNALHALGDEDAPSDTALAMDQNIKHLLIDEFQDTSISQFKLIEKLIQGWEPDDGRSLFIVGDPMQSIYRFRQADVGLFLQAKSEGLGPRVLNSLSLSSNFRSSPCLVDWVNKYCGPAFPAVENRDLGAIEFSASIAAREPSINSYVKSHYFASSLLEAQWITQEIKLILQDNPEESVAILVRSRSQLEHIIPQLQIAELDFTGVELFALVDQAHIRDIYTLTQVLLLPCERLPWFCFLRGPYVGLGLEDLHQFSLYAQEVTLLSSMLQVIQAKCLTQDGQHRIEYVYSILNKAMDCKDQYFLSTWIMHAHQELTHNLLPTTQQLLDYETYFSLIDTFHESQFMFDWNMFEQAFSRMYASQVKKSAVTVMTIHQSKGLEFDTVFLPCLSARSRPNDARLIRWMNVIDNNKEQSWIISPLKSAEDSVDQLYDFLGSIEQEKEKYERIRLLYVAVTRARKRLILTDDEDKLGSKNFRSLLKNVNFEHILINESNIKVENSSQLMRFNQRFYNSDECSVLNESKLGSGHERPILSIEDSNAAALGTIAHSWIQCICEQGLDEFVNLPWDRMQTDMLLLGWDQCLISDSIQKLKQWLKNLMQSSRGKWLIASYPESYSEYAFVVKELNYTTTYIVDRMFVDKGKRWIVDFKTGVHDFSTEEKHRHQVSRYAQYLSDYFQESIFCGVYYLSIDHWIEWVHEK